MKLPASYDKNRYERRSSDTEPTEANMVRLLDEWSLKWKHKGRTRAVGLGAYEKYCTLGLYAHGGISGIISRASNDENACRAINHFLRARFPGKTWTYAVTLGSFTGGRIWVENENGDAPEEVNMKTKVRSLIGSWHDMTSRSLSHTT